MCGIYGAFSLSSDRPLARPEVVERMGAALRHRGPDGHAMLTSSLGRLGTERLRVIDLDPRADQPFASPDERYWLACNGEIYNAPELRRRFSGYPFRSRSDVETILPLFAARGTETPRELDGMFALAVWDAREQRLTLARDRAGEKPLFYSRLGEEIWFASELQALLEHPQIDREIDPAALAEYLALGYILEPRTLLRGVHRVEAGTILTFDPSGSAGSRYWDATEMAARSREPKQPVDELRGLLEAAIAKQVVADVPVGVFTSGGLDSSLLAVLAARILGPDRVHTFAARFVAPSYDESGWAERSARITGTRHVEVVCDEATLGEAFDRVSAGLAEPLADPAVLPSFLLARRAREHVTVILSGEGADELFGGYPTYLGHRLAPMFAGLPTPFRKALRAMARRLPPSSAKVTFEFLVKRFLTGAERPWVERHLTWFGTGWPGALSGPASGWLDELAARYAAFPALPGALLLDYRTYLPDDLLVKVDRATMLSSVEARAPYLDRDVTAFALALPVGLKLRRGATKWILKRAAEKWLPRELTRRRKRGLSVPVASWLNGALRTEVDRLLAPDRLRRQALFDPHVTSRLLAEHRSGTANHARALWALVVLERWLERWAPGSF